MPVRCVPMMKDLPSGFLIVGERDSPLLEEEGTLFFAPGELIPLVKVSRTIAIPTLYL